jgi:hypothetical protein
VWGSAPQTGHAHKLTFIAAVLPTEVHNIFLSEIFVKTRFNFSPGDREEDGQEGDRGDVLDNSLAQRVGLVHRLKGEELVSTILSDTFS